MPGPTELDAVNRPTWSQHAAEFVHIDSWTDPGERNAVTRIAPRARGARLLDVGVGAGRTAWLMHLLTPNYIAIDYTPEMVDAARAAHPALDIRLGDARDLGAFEAASFDVVMFSWNGLDALGHDDRQRVLDEFHRVLAPGGTLLFSTLLKSGVAYRQAPWTRTGSGNPLMRAARFGAHLPGNVARYRRELRNWRRLRPRIEDHGDWGVSPLAAHDYGLLVHFTTVVGQRRELEQHDFAVESVIANTGAEIGIYTVDPDAIYVHVIATALPSA